MLRPDEMRTTVRFGRCQLRPYSGELSVGGVPAELGRRALDILLLLLEAQGELVTKDEILRKVWPSKVVEENTLQVQISSLRRALAEDRKYLRTISGRGYRFIAEITTQAGGREALPGNTASPSALALDAQRLTNLPAPASPLIGREAETTLLLDLVSDHRLVTLIGAGGIGKTRLAIHVAHQVAPRFTDGVWLAELGPLADADLICESVAAALGLRSAGGAAAPERLARAIGSKPVLVVLDNCEHLIDAAARLTETLLRATPAAHILATSREPLRVEGERIFRVGGLDVPAEGDQDTEKVLKHAAVRLFIQRSDAADRRLSADGRIVATVASICRRLDGIPLAIELAAARAVMLGVDDLAAHLDDRFRLLTNGQRTALPRHQTLRATLDWSYDLLSDNERAILRRVAVFAGSFTLEAVCAVVAEARLAETEVINDVSSLIAKSLVSADVGGATGRHRLLETTRAYAFEKLAESGELESAARAHAEYYRGLFENAPDEWKRHSSADWLAAYRLEIDNVRSALDWSFSPGGDQAIGVSLSAAAVPLMFDLSFMEECRRRSEQALVAGEAGPTGGTRAEMQLRAALAAAQVYTRGPSPETIVGWNRVLEIATRLEDTEYQARALWGLWNAQIFGGTPQAGLGFARRFEELAAATKDATKQLMGHRILGISLHYLGDQPAARSHLEHMLARYVRTVHRWHTLGFRVDQGTVARATLARVLWLQGFPDQAIRMSEVSVEEAQAYDHVTSTCYVLVEAAIPLSLAVGDLEAAERGLVMLRRELSRHSFGIWEACARCFEEMLLIRRGDLSAGLPRLGHAVDDLRETGFAAHLATFVAALAEGLGDAGEPAAGLALIDDALTRFQRDGQCWYAAELLRIKGELLSPREAIMAERESEDCFRQALELAKRQGALSLQLRAALSFARLRYGQRRSRDARKILGSVFTRFTEGFETADLKAAGALLVRHG